MPLTLHAIISESQFNMKFNKERISLNQQHRTSLKAVKDNKNWNNNTIIKWKLENLNKLLQTMLKVERQTIHI